MNRLRTLMRHICEVWCAPNRRTAEMAQWLEDHSFTIRDGAA